MRSANDNVGILIDAMCNMICSIEETRKKLNTAREMLDKASHQNERIIVDLERCLADIKLSEKLVQHVQMNVETMLQTQAA